MQGTNTTLCNLIQYNSGQYLIDNDLDIGQASEKLRPDCVNWINLETIKADEINELARYFNIHPLIVGDITDADLLPKFEVFEDMLFFSTKMLHYNSSEEEIIEEHLSILMSHNLLITVQEGLPGDVFDQLRGRLGAGKGLVRKYETDFLFYNILNSVLDNYLLIVEKLRLKSEQLEVKMLANNSENVVSTIVKIKRDIQTLRTYTLPMREALVKMKVDGSSFIKPSSINYFQDLQDNLQYLITSFETSREMLKDLLDIHRSNQNMEMNKIMKTLTIISAIFIPLTFIAGVYGMNFRYMPELDANWGYFFVMVLMVLVATIMTIYMRLKRWF